MAVRRGLPLVQAWILVAWVLAPIVAKANPQVSSGASPQVQEQPVKKAEPAPDPNLAMRVKDHISRQLWKGRTTAVPADSGTAQKDDLGQLVERVRGVHLRPRPKGRGPASAQDRPAVEEPNAPSLPSVAPGTEPPPRDANSPARASMAVLEGVDPNAVAHPFRMAEVLVASDHLAQAVPFYQKALAQLDARDKKTASQRQWILLQLGRCWREDQPDRARQMFSQLISEYPDSPWLDLAKTWQGLADWYLTEQPWQLVRQAPRPTPKAGAGQ